MNDQPKNDITELARIDLIRKMWDGADQGTRNAILVQMFSNGHDLQPLIAKALMDRVIEVFTEVLDAELAKRDLTEMAKAAGNEALENATGWLKTHAKSAVEKAIASQMREWLNAQERGRRSW